MKIVLLIFSLLIISGCAGIQTSYYYDMNSENKTSVEYQGKLFNILDDTDKSSALVTEDMATDIFKSFVEGLTLSIADFTAPVSMFEGAVMMYLDENKNKKCEITRSNFISDGLGGGIGYEIFYKCQD